MKDSTDRKRKEFVEHWNKKMACNMPTKKEIRRNKRKMRSARRTMIRDFEEYMSAIALAEGRDE